MKKILSTFGDIFILLLTAIVLASILFDACKYTSGSFTQAIDGVDAAFGLVEQGVFSITLVLGYTLPIIVLLLCKVLLKKGKLQYLLLLGAFVC